MPQNERVSLVTCPSTSDDAEIVARTEKAIQQCGDYGRALRNARKIAIKINAGVHRIILTDGKQTELTEPAVVEGTIRAIRDVTDAEIILGDATTGDDSEKLYRALGYQERLARYANVRLVDFNHGERAEVTMTHPQPMFKSYWLPRELVEADTFVSVAKMKAHKSIGCTLSMKNLFGWMPTDVYGTPRLYLHDRLIRLPRVLVDLATHFKPCLNVVDGIVAADGSEWGGEARRPGVLLAGTNCVATDSIGARVMGFDPTADYPSHPFFYRRNTIQLAAERGLGPNRTENIEVIGMAPEAICAPFTVEPYAGDTRRDQQIRRGATCVARYLEQQETLAHRYEGRYLALFDGEILWDGPDMATMQSLEWESGRDWHNASQVIVRCVSPEAELEHFDWYRFEAERLPDEKAEATV